MFRSYLSFFLLFCGFARAAEPVDYVLSGRWVVTVDANDRVIENGAVAVRGDRIAAVGTRAEIDKQYKAKQRIDSPDGIIAPGLINTHTHAAMSLLRGIADDLKLQDWLEKFIFPAEAKYVDRRFRALGYATGVRSRCCFRVRRPTPTCTISRKWSPKRRKKPECAACSGKRSSVPGAPTAKTPADGLARTEKFFRAFGTIR